MLVGRLALIDRRIYFEYEPSFFATGLQLSPVHLNLKLGAQVAKNGIQGLFGVFNDSLPDGWGRLLLDRQVRSLGIPSEMLTPLDRLTYVGKYGMGALVYEPTATLPDAPSNRIQLDELAAESVKVFEGTEVEVVGELLALSGASSGARPKIMVGVSQDKKHVIHGQQLLPENHQHWMIKFTAMQDRKDAGAIEYAYSLMARAAGLEIPETHLFSSKVGSGYFGVQRFDRIQNTRVHMHSLSGLLHADHQLPSLDYKDLLKATWFLTKNVSEVKKAFQLCAFNILAHNRDDHGKNFAFLMDEHGHWRLAPAFDITFSSGPGGEHCTTIMGEGKNPGEHHLQSLAEYMSLPKTFARETVDRARIQVSRWKEFASAAGVSKSSLTDIAKTLAS